MSARIVLIGAGSAMFGLGTLGDILQCKALEGSTVVLHDINPQALQAVEETARHYRDLTISRQAARLFQKNSWRPLLLRE